MTDFRSLLSLCVVGILCSVVVAPVEVAAKTNIVIVVVDQLSTKDLQDSQGLPNLASLQSKGVTLRNFYAAPTKAATQAGLMTGLWPIRVGVHNQFPRQETKGLPASTTTLPQFLQTSGYGQQAFFGEWWLGSKQSVPDDEQFAFSEFQGVQRKLGPAFAWRKQFEGGNLQRTNKALALTSASMESKVAPSLPNNSQIATQAADYIRSLRDSPAPFFVFVSLLPENRVGSSGAPVGTGQSPIAAMQNGKVGGIATTRLMNTDRAVGTILAAVKETGEEDQTIVWVMGSRGEGSFEDRQTSVLSERNLRVASLLCYPEQLSGPAIAEGPCGYVDVFPTLLHLARINTLDSRLDGVPLFARGFVRNLFYFDESLAEARTFFHFFSDGTSTGEQIGATWGDLKLICGGANLLIPDQYAMVRYELFDIKRDPRERKNVWEKYENAGFRLLKLCTEFRTLENVPTVQDAWNIPELDKSPQPALMGFW